jgi:predicted ATPase
LLRVEGDLPARSWLCREVIGRQSELDELQTSLELAANGNPQLVMLAGEAGLGKSRLVRALVEAHSSLDKLIFFGQCIPQTQVLPFGPFLGAFRRYFSQTDKAKVQISTQSGLAYLLHIMPDLAAFYPEVRPVNLERNGSQPQQRYQLFQTILNGLREMYQDRQTTLLFILEDLQWAAI